MKEIVEALKKEPRLPIVATVLLAIAAITQTFLDSLIVYHTSTETFTFPLGIGTVAFVGLLYLIVIILSIRLLLQSLRSKRAPELDKKDERELLHEYMISDKSYRILVYGVVLYLVWVYSIALPILLLLVMLMRLRMRIKLGRE